MKLFTAGVATETNTFSPMPTGMAQYEETLLARGGVPDDVSSFAMPLVVFRNRARALGWQVVESLAAFAQPAGNTTAAVWQAFRDEIVADLRAAMPVDAVLLCLHGAMVADGEDDCEGDLIAAIRAVVGPGVPIGAELDPHCHLTPRMTEQADVLICYKEYPHTDQAERAEELFTMVTGMVEGRLHPHMAVYDCRMITTIFTTVPPMKGYLERVRALEGRDGVLSISVAHCFPWADVEEIGTRLLVVTDNQPEKGAALARELGMELFAMRGQTHARYLNMAETMAAVSAWPGGGKPLVLADVSDNAGGGAPSDNTELLRALLDAGTQDALLGMVWDPVAVEMALAAGVGARVRLRLGGKTGDISGNPVDVEATVTGVAHDAQQSFAGARIPIGDAVALRVGGLHVMANTKRCQVFHPDCFAAVGLDVAAMRVVVVKSANHFRAGFEPVAGEIQYVAAPGAIMPLFDEIPYTKIKRPLWPRVADPHGEA